MTKYPLWKYIVLIVVITFGLIYSAPVLFGEEPSVQISARSGSLVTEQTLDQIKQSLNKFDLKYKSIKQESERSALIRFHNVETQLKARDVIKAALGDDYTVALNLAPATPKFLSMLGAEPMKLGLDLRGGVHFLLAIDVDSLVERRMKGDLRSIKEELREAKVRYKSITELENNSLRIDLRDHEDFMKTKQILKQRFPELMLLKMSDLEYENIIYAQMSQEAIQKAENYAVEQTMTILRNRINELGVAEPIVQRQGADRIAVDLPGIQDTARAKQILGGTATVQMHLVDVNHDPVAVKESGNVPVNLMLKTFEGLPILLKERVILSGTSITGASATIGEDGRPAVSIRLGGGGEALFYRLTQENIGKPMSILFVETRMDSKIKDGKVVYVPRKTDKVISVATIKSALGNNFQISGITDPYEARNLALLLRAGALPAPISIIEESTVGPSLGKENISKGIFSIEVGFILIVVFMLAYYRLFGLVANIGLGLNMILLVAILSVLGATLTLPGIAGIVLTVGMAVDANVLIFERIREELRNGMSPHAAIVAGYDRAFSTIVDANVTTLIAAVALFALGTGAVKGFAVTLTIGLLTSMFTAITGTRAMINLIYGKRNIESLSIGI